MAVEVSHDRRSRCAGRADRASRCRRHRRGRHVRGQDRPGDRLRAIARRDGSFGDVGCAVPSRLPNVDRQRPESAPFAYRESDEIRRVHNPERASGGLPDRRRRSIRAGRSPGSGQRGVTVARGHAGERGRGSCHGQPRQDAGGSLMKTTIRILLTCALIGLSMSAAYAQGTARDIRTAPPAPVKGTSQLSVVVSTDEPSSRPLRRVSVSIQAGELDVPNIGVTDDEGRVVFRNLSAGNYLLTATRSGYVRTYLSLIHI